MQRFIEKVVWITGASSGIGEALAYEFCREGAKVILSARRADTLSEVRARCPGGAERTRVLPVDLPKPEALESAAEEAVGFWDRLDIMVHNGGVGHQDLVEATDLSVDRKIMETNYFGAVTLTKALLPGMKARGSGHFVVIGSLSSKFGVPRLSAYAASKHALIGGKEIHTVLVRRLFPGFFSRMIRNHPVKRWRKFKAKLGR